MSSITAIVLTRERVTYSNATQGVKNRATYVEAYQMLPGN